MGGEVRRGGLRWEKTGMIAYRQTARQPANREYLGKGGLGTMKGHTDRGLLHLLMV